MEQDIFKNGSTTYYWSSKFFPKAVRQDVFKLYSFVRVADDYVDQIPADTAAFNHLKKLYGAKKAPTGSTVDERVVRNIKELEKKYSFEKKWVKAFLKAMESDLKQKDYHQLKDSLDYVYGSAEVVGLMMARIMGLPDKSQYFAQLQGRAMQWINFIRDVQEDNQLGRCYFPKTNLKRFNLADLSKDTAHANPREFSAFISHQIELYEHWQSEARAGFRFVPKRLQIPLNTAVSMYDWTAAQIKKDPLLVYEKKIKPSKQRVILAALKSSFHA